jgi:hypothetical protein
MDEYSYSWVGMSLIESGYPMGISGIGGYENEILKYINVDNVFQGEAGGNALKINYPWFDHPPLLGLLTGGYAKFKGAVSFEDARSFLIRKPMLWLGVFTNLALIFLVAINYGYLASLMTGLIWAVIPVAVLSSRMVQAENGMIPVWILSLVFISLYKKYNRDMFLILGALLAGMACLFKLSGVVAIISGVVLLIYPKRGSKSKQDIKLWLFISLMMASLFVVYGLIIDAGQFLRSFMSNSSRFYGIGPEAIFNLIRESKLTNHKFVTEPWFLIGWISGFIFLSKKRLDIFSISLISYLVVYLFFGSYAYGWYSFPFWPIIIGMLGILLSDGILRGKRLLGLTVMLLIVWGGYISKFVDIVSFQEYANYWRIGISVLVFGLLMINKINRKLYIVLGKILVGLLFIFCIYLSMKFTDSVDISTWYRLS